MFPELCHSCGACTLLCPEHAISESPRRTGTVQVGHAGQLGTVVGTLDVGEAKSPPVIRAVRAQADLQADLVVVDAPPGTSCPVIESVRGADLVLLVSEPTPFGLHDLKLAVEMVRVLGLPLAVVANRADVGDDRLRDYCEREGIETLLEIPDDRRLAEAYSRGELAIDALPGYRERFTASPSRVRDKAGTSVARGLFMKQLVIISGKGGTGKTSVVAAFARLAEGGVLADCDVDAADLHLVVSAANGEPHAFSARKLAAIDPERCTRCGECLQHCRFGAVDLDPPRIDPFACEGCGLCLRLCPADAVRFEPVVNGEWSLAETPWGPLVHARLGVAEDNSGKLVSLVREEARRVAEGRALRPSSSTAHRASDAPSSRRSPAPPWCWW